MFFAFDVIHFRNINNKNKDIVYLSLLDSVRYLEPTKLRKSIYQNIVSSYFEYCRIIGFFYEKKTPRRRKIVDLAQGNYEDCLKRTFYTNFTK